MRKKSIPASGFLLGLIFLVYAIYANIHFGSEVAVHNAQICSWIILLASTVTVVIFSLAVGLKKGARIWTLLGLLL